MTALGHFSLGLSQFHSHGSRLVCEVGPQYTGPVDRVSSALSKNDHGTWWNNGQLPVYKRSRGFFHVEPVMGTLASCPWKTNKPTRLLSSGTPCLVPQEADQSTLTMVSRRDRTGSRPMSK